VFVPQGENVVRAKSFGSVVSALPQSAGSPPGRSTDVRRRAEETVAAIIIEALSTAPAIRSSSLTQKKNAPPERSKSWSKGC